ncbi:hypothetical protein [Streptomyces sp. SID8499]|uniref:hypothetical protein n=1 Tax=Streptomyces sp. SID8499 TaxID=2706106 RepID=UPI0013C83AC6|nr:hypothetical protein [Streptomyces sp. SID8499]
MIAVPLRKTSYAALVASIALLASCSAAQDIEVGSDWKGSETFVTARVSGRTVVVGIDPAARHAQTLAVVPRADGDDDVAAPQLVRSGDGTWWLSLPGEGGHGDRLFRLDPARHALEERGSIGQQTELVPGRRLLATVPAADGPGGPGAAGRRTAEVLVRDAKTWKRVRGARVPGPVTLTAPDPSGDSVCLAAGEDDGMEVSVLDLATGRVRRAGRSPGVQVQQLACAAGVPVLAGSPAADGGGTAVRAALSHVDGATVVSVTGGRVDAVQATEGTVVLAVNRGQDSDLVELDRASGRELRRVTADGVDDSYLLRPTRSGWLMVSDDTATVVDLTGGTSHTFDLPGPLTSL